MLIRSLAPLTQQFCQLLETASLAPASDRELLERFVMDQDSAAFEALVRRHGGLVLAACQQVLADPADVEDTFQATFLVLLSKASSIRKQQSVSSWLFGTAHRLALQMRASACRRKQREVAAGQPITQEQAPPDPSWRETVAVLHEELNALPDRFRLPLLLCYLEGKSRDEAAEQLGWTRGSVKGRLERGREVLRKRLVGRGITLSAGLLGALAHSSATARCSSRLVQATLTAATSGPSARVAALTTGVSTAMFSSKVKLVSCLIVCLGLLLGVAGHRLSPPPSSASQAALPVKPSPKSTAADRETEKITLRGQVFDPDGKPLAGAKLLLLGEGDKPVELGTSTEEGRFTIEVPKATDQAYLVAQRGKAGIDFLSLEGIRASKPVELRLVKDQAIRGRVIDTEGKPVSGVRVEARDLGVYQDNSLDSFLTLWKKRHYMSGVPGGVKHLWNRGGRLFTTKTDAEGQFVLHGVGGERFVSLWLTGSGIAHTRVWVVNRKDFDPKPYNQAARQNIPKGMERFATKWLLYGPNLSVVAEPGKTIRGVVKDLDTGKPCPDIEVMFTRQDQGDLVTVPLTARSDAEGKYEIHGAHKTTRYMVEVRNDPQGGYMGRQVWGNDTPAYQPVTINIGLKKGVIITGRVIDKTTGKPIPGFATVEVLSDNPFVKDYPKFNFSAYPGQRVKTGPDGTFRIAAFPGPVILMGGPDHRLPNGFRDTLRYKPAVPDPKYPQYIHMDKDHPVYLTASGYFLLVQGNFCKILETKPGAGVVKQDIIVERANARTVKLQDSDGKPLPGALVTGINTEKWQPPIRCDNDSCPVYGLEPGKPRRMVFFHPERKLAVVVMLAGDEKQPIVVKLRPVGSLAGRLVDADGKPLAGVMVDLKYRDREAVEVHQMVHHARLVVTDASGAFAINDVIPGLAFELTFGQGRQKYEREAKADDPTASVKPGQSRNLGPIRLKAKTGE
jgi:RNA polymerase sigma factor (sigma-70 family)